MTSTAPIRELAATPPAVVAVPATARPRALWSSRSAFVLAAAGSAAGLGDVWKFGYITGTHGGSAFLLVHVACLALVGLPIMMAELLVGRRGARNVVDALGHLAGAGGRDVDAWRAVGAVGALTALLSLAYYSVVGGWSLSYLADGVAGRLTGGDDPARIPALFTALLASPSRLVLWHSAFMAATVAIVARGITGGIERAARIMMPALLALLAGLVAHAALTSGEFARTLGFLLRPDFSALGAGAVLEAMGHAFFTLGIGAGVMLAFGSRLPRDVSIPRAATQVVAIDTGIALLAGLAIFPMVFAHGLAPAQGPGLLFVSVPVSLAHETSLVTGAFFAFVALAALTTAIALLEPGVDVACDRLRLSRPRGAVLVGGAVWALGVAASLAFNRWSHVTFGDRNVFDLLAFWTSSVLVPAGGIALALFAGWVLSRRATADELGLGDGAAYRAWRLLVRWVAPAGVAAALVYGLRG